MCAEHVLVFVLIMHGLWTWCEEDANALVALCRHQRTSSTRQWPPLDSGAQYTSTCEVDGGDERYRGIFRLYAAVRLRV
jgi:hypothetical protein